MKGPEPDRSRDAVKTRRFRSDWFEVTFGAPMDLTAAPYGGAPIQSKPACRYVTSEGSLKKL
jgi:hypothetical protein